MSFRVVLGGDVMLGRSFQSLPTSWQPFGNLGTITQSADLVLVNLECAITRSVAAWPDKVFHFRMKPEHVVWLSDIHTSAVSLANNHILDYNLEGMYDTIAHLDAAGIGYSGAGENIGQASAGTVFMVGPYRVVYLAMADHYHYWAAGQNSPGIWYVDLQSSESMSKVLSRVHSVTADLLIVSIHWGSNWHSSMQPSAEMQHFGRALVDAGANLVCGTSAHHVLPCEPYHNGLIFYSMGDLIDDYAVNEQYRSDLAFLAVVLVSPAQMSAHIVPTKINSLQVEIASDPLDIDFVLQHVKV